MYDQDRHEQIQRMQRAKSFERLGADHAHMHSESDLQSALHDLAVWRMTDSEFQSWKNSVSRTEARAYQRQRDFQAHYAVHYGYDQLEAWRISHQKDATFSQEQYAEHERELERHPGRQGVISFVQKSCWTGPAPGDAGEIDRLHRAGAILAPNHDKTYDRVRQPELISREHDCPF